jgi:hypothetical protein
VSNNAEAGLVVVGVQKPERDMGVLWACGSAAASDNLRFSPQFGNAGKFQKISEHAQLTCRQHHKAIRVLVRMTLD